jgi:hypothetical protein
MNANERKWVLVKAKIGVGICQFGIFLAKMYSVSATQDFEIDKSEVC